MNHTEFVALTIFMASWYKYKKFLYELYTLYRYKNIQIFILQ